MPNQESSFSSRVSGRRGAALLLLAGLLLILLWLGLKAWRLAQIAESLQEHQAAFTILAAEGMANADPDTTEELVMAVRSDVVALRREVKAFLPLAPLFGWLPKVGPVFAEARPLLIMADAGTEAAAYTVRGLKPALVVMQNPSPGGRTLGRIVPILAEARPDLRRADAALDKVVAARADIKEPEALPWRVRTLLEEVDSKLYLADMFDLLLVAPELLGHDAPRSYLIIAQNEDELRPTGGFISGAGLLIIDHGDIVTLQFQDANLVDAWEGGYGTLLTKPYEFAPEPLWDLMNVQLLLFRDANYWADFPTSAAKVLELYSYGQNVPAPDGVIAVDQHFLELLLSVTGPVAVDSLQTTVSAGNIVQNLREAWQTVEEGETAGDWLRGRKDFLGPVAGAIKDRLLVETDSIDLLYLADKMYEALEQKHLQIYVDEPAIAAVMRERGWDNRLIPPPEGDFLMVVDSNVGYNKANSYVRTALAYEVVLDETGHGVATTTASYTHTLQRQLTCRQGGQVSYAEFPAYEDLAQDCFWNYLRLYVPPGSELQQASSHPYPRDIFTVAPGWEGEVEAASDLAGLDMFHNFFLLAPDETIKSVYTYSLPKVTRKEGRRERYQLTLFRQPGVAPRAVTVTITLPPGARVVDVEPAPTGQQGNTVSFQHELNSDLIISLLYAP